MLLFLQLGYLLLEDGYFVLLGLQGLDLLGGIGQQVLEFLLHLDELLVQLILLQG